LKGLIRNSKTPRPVFLEILKKLELKDYFDVVILSGEIGYKKPHKNLMDKCVQISGLESVLPEKILFIGNETGADVLGGKCVGWKTVLVRHTEQSSHGLADFEIDSLEELEQIIFGEKNI